MDRGGREGLGGLDRREFVRRLSYGSAALLGATSIGGLGACERSSGPSVVRRPNIVLIMADDMGFSDIGCYGGELRTPNLDALAGGGLRFTHFHNTSRCCPSRASLLTGLYPHQTGVGDMMNDEGLPGYRGDLNRNCVTLAEVLKGAGYSTYATGKWHVTRFSEPDDPKHNWPLQRGFDRFFGTIIGSGSYFDPYSLTLDNDYVTEPGEGFYYTDAIADHALRFVGEHLDREPDTPFFLYQTFTAPHWPLHARDEDIARTRGRFDAGWDRLRAERHERMLATGIVDPRWALTERDARVPAWEEVGPDREWYLRRMEVYAAQVEEMDRQIGRFVDELRTRGVLNDTMILFLADNGGCAEELNTPGWINFLLSGGRTREVTRDGRRVRVGNDPTVMPGPEDTFQSYGVPWANVSNTPFRLYKSFTHAGGVATPLIVHWPAGFFARGALRHQRGHLVDVMATLVAVSRATYPTSYAGEAIQPMEGTSLTPAFIDAPLDRDAIYFEHEGSRAVIDRTWKAVAQGRNGAWELYDVVADRTETVDLAQRFPEELGRLTAGWDDWAQRANVIRP